jgi:hypothetical protein
MSNEQRSSCDELSAEELQAELRRLKENLQDLEEMHAFTFGKTTVHIGAEQAQSMQDAYEEECREYRERIKKIEGLLKAKAG